MQVYRFFVNKITGGSAVIQGEDFNHAVSVLRLGIGDSVNIFNYEHGEFKAVISDINKNERAVLVAVGEQLRGREQSAVKIAAAIALIKKENMELVLEKLTEIGVDEIIPVITKRSVVKIKEEEKKQARWEKIIYEAVKQSGRLTSPVLHKTCGSVRELADAAGEGMKLLAWEKEEKNLLIDEVFGAKAPERVVFFTGPEGGFEESEAKQLIDSGFKPVSLGSNTLRAETAAIAAAATLVQGLRRGAWKN